MSDKANLDSSAVGGTSNTPAAMPEKGKGKSLDPPQDVSMDEDDDSSDSNAEEEVCFLRPYLRGSMLTFEIIATGWWRYIR